MKNGEIVDSYKGYVKENSQVLLEVSNQSDDNYVFLIKSTDNFQKLIIIIDEEKWLNIERSYNDEVSSLYEGLCDSPGHLRRILLDIVVPVYQNFNHLKNLKDYIDYNITLKAYNQNMYNMLLGQHVIYHSDNNVYTSFNGEIYYKLIKDYEND